MPFPKLLNAIPEGVLGLSIVNSKIVLSKTTSGFRLTLNFIPKNLSASSLKAASSSNAAPTFALNSTSICFQLKRFSRSGSPCLNTVDNFALGQRILTAVVKPPSFIMLNINSPCIPVAHSSSPAKNGSKSLTSVSNGNSTIHLGSELFSRSIPNFIFPSRVVSLLRPAFPSSFTFVTRPVWNLGTINTGPIQNGGRSIPPTGISDIFVSVSPLIAISSVTLTSMLPSTNDLKCFSSPEISISTQIPRPSFMYPSIEPPTSTLGIITAFPFISNSNFRSPTGNEPEGSKLSLF